MGAVTTVKTELRNLLPFIGVLIVFLVVLTGEEAKNNASLKNQINTVVREECLANTSAAVFEKYDSLVRTNIEQQQTAFKLNKGHDPVKAVADLSYEQQFRAALIAIPTPKQLASRCAIPLLK